jgi:hypothetical protein
VVLSGMLSTLTSIEVINHFGEGLNGEVIGEGKEP